MMDASVPVRRRTAGGMSFGFSDGVLVPVAMLPSQFRLGSRAISPARALALAVLEQAVTDVRDQRFARTRCGQRVYWDTYQWVTADDREWPYSFTNLCAALGLDVDSVRRCILDPAASCGPPAAEAQPDRQSGVGQAA
jgi:hypothetical protein